MDHRFGLLGAPQIYLCNRWAMGATQHGQRGSFCDESLCMVAIEWLLYFISFALPVVLQGYLSWRIGLLTPSQMQEHGLTIGLPFVAHTGMWSDLSLYAGLMATIMAFYASQWTWEQWAVALLFGLAGSAATHWGLYVQSPFEQAHVAMRTATGEPGALADCIDSLAAGAGCGWGRFPRHRCRGLIEAVGATHQINRTTLSAASSFRVVPHRGSDARR